MQIIEQACASEYEVKKSRFIAHLLPIDQFEAKIKELRGLHPKARHFVTAFRRINSFDQVEEGFGDDGEPKGVAGMPTLKVLQGADIVNAGVVTVRYFGGIKLGTGGMARAYADATNLAVAEASLGEYIKPFFKEVTVAYNELGRLEHLAASYADIAVVNKVYETAAIRVELSGREQSVEDMLTRLKTT